MTTTDLDMTVEYSLHTKHAEGHWYPVPSTWDAVRDDYVPSEGHLRSLLVEWLRQENITSGEWALSIFSVEAQNHIDTQVVHL